MSNVTDALDQSKYPVEFLDYMKEESELAIKFVNGYNILEVGFGKGRNISEIYPFVKSYTGIDNDKDAFNETSKKFNNKNNIKLLLLDAINLSKKYKKDYFDRAICLFSTMACVADPIEVLKKISIVTKDQILITLPCKGVLALREKYYKNLNLKYKVDKNTETISSEAWTETRAYNEDDIENLARAANLKVIKKGKLGKMEWYVILSKKI